MSTPESTPTAEIQLTRVDKEKLLQQMYTLPHWISVIRLFAYRSLPMDAARQAIKPIAEEYGKEPVANACEVLVEISTQGKETSARLKSHIRRMAFQILGPEVPGQEANVPIDAMPELKPPRPAGRKKPKKSPTASVSPTPRENADTASPPDRSTIMQQYQAAKEKHPNMLLLFRMGDFFELFGEDAETAHKLLGLTLTTRDQTVTMAGFPHHQLETYLHKLLKEGQRVAVCEPVDESLARGPIRREVTRVVTPGDGSSKTTKRPARHDAPNGARTIRLLTQLAFAYHYESILRGLRNSILDLYHQGGIGGIIPVLISSSGGGTGSALQILFPQALNDPWFASRLTEGLPSGVLQTPILFLVEPFAYALRNQTMHADKILANSYGFRMESVLLEAMHAYKYCFHLGLANEDGAVLDSPEEIAKVLGTSVYQFERHWPQIKGRVVDTADTHALTARYTGYDIPEHVIHRANGVPIASYAPDSPNGEK